MLALSPATAYILTRTVGLPFDTSDIGDWGNRLGTASLFVEGVVLLTASFGLWLAMRGQAEGPRLATYPKKIIRVPSFDEDSFSAARRSASRVGRTG